MVYKKSAMFRAKQVTQMFSVCQLISRSVFGRSSSVCTHSGTSSSFYYLKSNMSHLKTADLLFEEKPLYVPPLDEVQSVLQEAFNANFETASVTVADCPDLRQPQYGLVEPGLGGATTVLEVGGPPYLTPFPNLEKLYNIKEIARRCIPSGKILAVGAGAGPYPLRNTNCEGIFNLSVGADDTLNNGSYTAKVKGPQEECVLERIPSDEPRCAILLQLFLSHGEPGKVLKITAKRRTGKLNFLETVRQSLEAKYGKQTVGMGGLFLIKKGEVHQHVMRDFSKEAIDTEQQLSDWLKFYDMPAQLNAVGTLVTNEHDLDLRLTHFHSFSNSNWGGHYHHDTTPDIVEYEAYLNVADRVVRVDRPQETHKMGRI